MTFIVQRKIICNLCNRDTGRTFDYDIENDEGGAVVYEVCDNCDHSKLPAPFRVAYDDDEDDDEEAPHTDPPYCPDCSHDCFNLMHNGEMLDAFANDACWCYECGRYEHLADLVSQTQRQALPPGWHNGATIHCEDCGCRIDAEVQW